MRVTNNDIWSAKDAAQSLLQEKLPVKVAYRLAKLIRLINENIRDVDTVRTRLIKEYGESGEDGSISVGPTSPRWEEFVEKFNSLMLEEVDIPLDKITITDIDLNVSPSVLLSLDPFVE